MHALHFAAAQLRIDRLEAVGLRMPGCAPVTSMGHTLLHVACLPFNQGQIQSSARKISQSSHDVRAMNPKFRPSSRMTTTYSEDGQEKVEMAAQYRALCCPGGAANKKGPSIPSQQFRAPEKDRLKQEAACKLILATCGDDAQVSTPDKHGNNMLHYLASIRNPNTSLIDWAKQQEGGFRAWKSERNFWGFTAQDLYEEGRIARSGPETEYLASLSIRERKWVLGD